MSYHDIGTSSHKVEAQILDAAQRLLAANAGHEFTMEQLAQECHLSRATLYRRVGSKGALVRRLARERGIQVVGSEDHDIPSRILQAARVTFGKHGLARTTMQQIAEEAGLGVATLYRHFGDRDSLIRAFMQEYTPRRAFREVAQHDSGDIEADLIHLITEMLTFLRQNRDMIWLGLTEREEIQRLRDRLGDVPERTRAELTRFLESAAVAGQLQDWDPQQMATALAGMLMIFALDVPFFGGPPLEDPRQAAEFIVHLFLRGLGTSDSS